jgi:ribosomal protein S18 acetylase RimI-like enzyme
MSESEQTGQPIELRPATWQDYDFAYHVLKTSMREHVERVWRWDEEWQQAYFREHFDPDHNQVIVVDGLDVGLLGTERRGDAIHVNRIYILPEHQNRGIGTHLLESILDQAAREGLAVTLRVLRGNPARRLYQRLGFRTTLTTETHDLMRATPVRARPQDPRSS